MDTYQYSNNRTKFVKEPQIIEPPIIEQPTTVQEPEKLPTPSPRNRKPLILAALGVSAIAAGTYGYRWWQFASTHQSTDNATIAGHVYQISSRISGSVSNVLVDDNQIIKQGQTLIQLDPQDYQVAVQQAQASLNVAQRKAEAAQSSIAQANQTTAAQATETQGTINGALTDIATAQAAVTEAQAGVPAAQSELAQTQATLTRETADYQRYQSLYDSGAVSRQQLESSRASYEVALAARNAAKQGVNQAQAKLIQAQKGVQQAQSALKVSQSGLQRVQANQAQTQVNQGEYQAAKAAIAQAQANLAQTQLQLSYTNITAPVTGRIGRKNVEIGERIQSGQPLMAVVGKDLWIVANFKETQLAKMKAGESVEVEIDSFPGRTFTGTVDSLSPASGAEFSLLPPDNATGNFTKIVQRIPVKIRLNPDSVKGYESRIVPGMSANVTVDVGK
ncbi:HlyD family secretion protein [Chroococcus sp. FPU101]|uniref:HlyD family secretion protein n=1 Tax=Chroococcus sp. FPU101 TaxID=1974212 RepID=UPI001A8D35DB|nr:HlyD family secretion protein [Chroococcus sp. FPU101]GFE69143.1 secretion protein HlyD [Chroococcus sp. FPU101]